MGYGPSKAILEPKGFGRIESSFSIPVKRADGSIYYVSEHYVITFDPKIKLPCTEILCLTPSVKKWDDLHYQVNYTATVQSIRCVGGFCFPIDKVGLLAPYVGLASTILVATVATAIYVKSIKRKET